MRPPVATSLLALLPTLLLAGCDLLGIEGASALAARREAEGKAVGGACRHAARSIEQCYGSNKKADKAAVFAGWREMNDYMRENKIEAMPAPPPAPPPAPEGEEGDGGAEAASAPAKKPAAVAKAAPGKVEGAGKAQAVATKQPR